MADTAFEKLIQHAKSGKVDEINRILQNESIKNEILDKKDELGNRALNHAIQFDHYKVVEKLIDHGSDVKLKNERGLTPLHWASYYNRPQIVKLLLKKGADIDGRNQLESTPLHEAVERKNIEVVKILIAAGADLNALNKVRVSPLYTAARRGSLQCCELLLDKTLRDRKANVNLLNENNENALFAILRFDISDNVSQVEIQKQRNEAMQIVQLLLDENIRIDCINKDKSTPLKLIKSKFGLSKDKSAYYKHIEELIVKAEKQREYHELMIEEGILPDIGKLFVCGHGGVGKTTLKDALQRDWIQAKITSRFKERCPDPGKDDYTPTAGIDVQSIKLPDGTKFSVWDYAGQAEFYVTHTMFLDASTATFIVVYKIADYRMSEEGIKFMKPSEIYEEQKKKVEYWLRFIRSTNAGRKSEDEDKRPHVILVASRADWAKEFPNEAKQVAQTIHDEVQETFKDDLKILDDVFVINCHNSQCSDMERLRKILKERKAAVLKNKRPMPNICSRILKSKDTWLNKNLDDHGSGAQSEQFPVMRWDDYYKFVKKYIAPKIEEEFLKKATNYLHDIGEVLYVRNLGSSGSTKRQDIVVLKPQWLCNRIFGPMLATDIFLQFAKKFTKKKIYPRKDIDEVLGENADCDLLIELLKDFELLFLNPGSPEESYIIPGLLIEDMPEGQWERSASMKRYFGRRIRCKSKKDGFSPGLFPRLQTRIYQELTQHGRPPSGIWRNGIKFSYGIEGLLYMANDAINIIVRGRDDSEIGECYEVLEMVTRDIYDVLDVSCPGVDVEMCILSALSLHDHCKPELVHAYPLSKILEAEKLKIKVYDEEFGKEEEITTLLCPGFDRTVLNEMGEQTDVKWMLHPSRKKFVDLLEVKHPVGWDHRNMAQFMDIDYEKVMALQEHANNSNKRVTDLILDAWSENWAQKKRKFGNSTNVKGNNKYHVIFFESSFQNLKAIFQIDELAYRDDVKAVIEGMFRRLEISPGDPASDSEEDSDAYEE